MLLLVRFGEIGVKSPPVRRRFTAKLQANIEAGLARHGVEADVERSWSRLYVETDDAEAAAEVLRRTFGIVSFSPVHLAEADPDKIADRAVELMKGRFPDGRIGAFAVRPRRHGNHDFSSRDVGVVVGAAVEDAFDAPVDLDDPDTEVFVEVRDNAAYVFFEKIDGPGGLPVACQGRVALAWGPGAPLAGWLLLRRGVELHPIVPEGREDEVKLLAAWAPDLEAVALDLDPADVGPGAWLAAVDRIAHERDLDSIATAYVLEQGFADRLERLREITHLPLLNPLEGLDADARADLARRTGLPEGGEPPPDITTPIREPDANAREVTV